MAQYVKQDCEQGFVTDNAEIEYLKLNNVRHAVLGCMLGDFDAEGNYAVEPEIVKELIEMPKYIVDTVDNIDVCSSVIKLDKQITFFVVFEGEKVSLVLAEKVNFQANFKINSGLFSNINEYVLDSFETSGMVDKNAVYAKWNISQFAGEALDVFNMDEETLAKYFGVVNRFKYLMKANQILLQKEAEVEEIESAFAVQMLDLVAKYPELKKVVDVKIKEVVGKQPTVIRLDKPFFAKTVNEIISQTVEENVNILPPQEKQAFEAEKRNIVVEHNIKFAQTIDIKRTPILDENHEVISSKFSIDTLDADKKQSLTDVATEFIETKTQTNKKNVQDAVMHVVEPNVREKFTEATGAKVGTNKDILVGKIAEIAGQTRQQFGENSVDKETQEIVTTVTEKMKVLKTTQVQNQVTSLVGKAVEEKQAQVKQEAKAAAKKPEVKKPAKKAEKKAEKKADKKTDKPAEESSDKAKTEDRSKGFNFVYPFQPSQQPAEQKTNAEISKNAEQKNDVKGLKDKDAGVLVGLMKTDDMEDFEDKTENILGKVEEIVVDKGVKKVENRESVRQSVKQQNNENTLNFVKNGEDTMNLFE